MGFAKGSLRSHSLIQTWAHLYQGNGHPRAMGGGGRYQHLGNSIISPSSQASSEVLTGTRHRNGETGEGGHPGNLPGGGEREELD